MKMSVLKRIVLAGCASGSRAAPPPPTPNSRMTRGRPSSATWWSLRPAWRLRVRKIRHRQVGLFLCFPEHDTPTDADIFPVRQALWRLGIRDGYVLLAGGPQAQKFGMADMEPIEKLIAWAKKTYPINPRRVYMFGKGEGGKISAEFTMTHPSIVTAAISHSWGFWVMPSELKEPIDFQNSAPELYMNLGLRDLATHLTTVRDTYPRVKAKGYHVIYREFEDMSSRSYYPPSNDDSIAWATRLRNKNIELSAEEQSC